VYKEYEKCVHTERQSVEVRMGGGRNLLCNTVRSNWENECIQDYVEEERYGGKREFGDCRR
jgi:hypothetical protein